MRRNEQNKCLLFSENSGIVKMVVIALLFLFNVNTMQASGLKLKITGPGVFDEPTEDIVRPRRGKAGESKVYIDQINDQTFEVYFAADFSDVAIELTDDEGYTIGLLEADNVCAGDTVVVTTTDSGAINIIVFAGDDVIYETNI